MSMLSRYKKKGGFTQLLNLIETSGGEKREKFLKLIEEEDPRWAEAIKQKMITIKKIFSWDDNTVAEIVSRLNDLTVAVAMHGLDSEAKEKAKKMMGHSRLRKIEDLMAEKAPNPAEISTVFVQILTEVRNLIAQGYLYLEKIDPSLVIDSDMEDKLSTSTLFTLTNDPAPEAKAASPGVAEAKGQVRDQSSEVEALKRRLNQLMAENNQLKEKLVQVDAKLSQIRKLAA